MATKNTTKLIRQESPNLIPERDLGAIPVLQAEHLGIDFGGLTAVNDFNIALGPTEISGIIGPNGAGKTTVFNLLTCVYKPTRGSVMIDGYDLAGKSVVEANHMSSVALLVLRCSACSISVSMRTTLKQLALQTSLTNLH